MQISSIFKKHYIKMKSKYHIFVFIHSFFYFAYMYTIKENYLINLQAAIQHTYVAVVWYSITN